VGTWDAISDDPALFGDAARVVPLLPKPPLPAAEKAERVEAGHRAAGSTSPAQWHAAAQAAEELLDELDREFNSK
jgi:hypothetical protein